MSSYSITSSSNMNPPRQGTSKLRYKFGSPGDGSDDEDLFDDNDVMDALGGMGSSPPSKSQSRLVSTSTFKASVPSSLLNRGGFAPSSDANTNKTEEYAPIGKELVEKVKTPLKSKVAVAKDDQVSALSSLQLDINSPSPPSPIKSSTRDAPTESFTPKVDSESVVKSDNVVPPPVPAAPVPQNKPSKAMASLFSLQLSIDDSDSEEASPVRSKPEIRVSESTSSTVINASDRIINSSASSKQDEGFSITPMPTVSVEESSPSPTKLGTPVETQVGLSASLLGKPLPDIAPPARQKRVSSSSTKDAIPTTSSFVESPRTDDVGKSRRTRRSATQSAEVLASIASVQSVMADIRSARTPEPARTVESPVKHVKTVDSAIAEVASPGRRPEVITSAKALSSRDDVVRVVSPLHALAEKLSRSRIADTVVADDSQLTQEVVETTSVADTAPASSKSVASTEKRRLDRSSRTIEKEDFPEKSQPRVLFPEEPGALSPTQSKPLQSMLSSHPLDVLGVEFTSPSKVVVRSRFERSREARIAQPTARARSTSRVGSQAGSQGRGPTAGVQSEAPEPHVSQSISRERLGALAKPKVRPDPPSEEPVKEISRNSGEGRVISAATLAALAQPSRPVTAAAVRPNVSAPRAIPSSGAPESTPTLWKNPQFDGVKSRYAQPSKSSQVAATASDTSAVRPSIRTGPASRGLTPAKKRAISATSPVRSSINSTENAGLRGRLGARGVAAPPQLEVGAPVVRVVRRPPSTIRTVVVDSATESELPVESLSIISKEPPKGSAEPSSPIAVALPRFAAPTAISASAAAVVPAASSLVIDSRTLMEALYEYWFRLASSLEAGSPLPAALGPPGTLGSSPLSPVPSLPALGQLGSLRGATAHARAREELNRLGSAPEFSSAQLGQAFQAAEPQLRALHRMLASSDFQLNQSQEKNQDKIPEKSQLSFGRKPLSEHRLSALESAQQPRVRLPEVYNFLAEARVLSLLQLCCAPLEGQGSQFVWEVPSGPSAGRRLLFGQPSTGFQQVGVGPDGLVHPYSLKSPPARAQQRSYRYTVASGDPGAGLRVSDLGDGAEFVEAGSSQSFSPSMQRGRGEEVAEFMEVHPDFQVVEEDDDFVWTVGDASPSPVLRKTELRRSLSPSERGANARVWDSNLPLGETATLRHLYFVDGGVDGSGGENPNNQSIGSIVSVAQQRAQHLSRSTTSGASNSLSDSLVPATPSAFLSKSVNVLQSETEENNNQRVPQSSPTLADLAHIHLRSGSPRRQPLHSPHSSHTTDNFPVPAGSPVSRHMGSRENPTLSHNLSVSQRRGISDAVSSAESQALGASLGIAPIPVSAECLLWACAGLVLELDPDTQPQPLLAFNPAPHLIVNDGRSALLAKRLDFSHFSALLFFLAVFLRSHLPAARAAATIMEARHTVEKDILKDSEITDVQKKVKFEGINALHDFLIEFLMYDHTEDD